MEAFEDFKERKYDFLLATDLAARGLDIKELKVLFISNYTPKKKIITRELSILKCQQRQHAISIVLDVQHAPDRVVFR